MYTDLECQNLTIYFLGFLLHTTEIIKISNLLLGIYIFYILIITQNLIINIL